MLVGVGRGVGGPAGGQDSAALVWACACSYPWTVSFNYNCVTVRRPRVYLKLSIAISIVLDSGVSLGCSPPPRKGARGRVHRPPSVPSSARHAQVPDLTFDYNIRARRRRRRRLSGGATQTGRSGSRTGLVCPSPARMAARQPSNPTDLSPTSPRGRPRRRLHLGKLGRVRRYRSMQPSIVQAQPIM